MDEILAKALPPIEQRFDTILPTWLTKALIEFLVFGIKQAWACLFGGLLLAGLIATHYFYPESAPLSRYDFLVVYAASTQVIFLITRLERPSEALVILIFHIVGTAMEVFKTDAGSWTYPEDNLLATGIYINFLSHHIIWDVRYALFAFTALIFLRCQVHYRVWRWTHQMPLLVGFFLVSLFIWLAENIATFTQTWLYPGQEAGWHMVSLQKLGSWYLLMIVSWVLVTLIHPPQAVENNETAND